MGYQNNERPDSNLESLLVDISFDLDDLKYERSITESVDLTEKIDFIKETVKISLFKLRETTRQLVIYQDDEDEDD